MIAEAAVIILKFIIVGMVAVSTENGILYGIGLAILEPVFLLVLTADSEKKMDKDLVKNIMPCFNTPSEHSEGEAKKAEESCTCRTEPESTGTDETSENKEEEKGE